MIRFTAKLMSKSSAIDIGLKPPLVVSAVIIWPTIGAFTISARVSPGGGGGMFSPENPPERYPRPPKLVMINNPFPTIRRTMERVDRVPAATDLQTPREKNPPTTPATAHVIKS